MYITWAFGSPLCVLHLYWQELRGNPTHSPAIHHYSLSTIPALRPTDQTTFAHCFCFSSIKGPQNPANLLFLHSNALDLFRKFCHRTLWKLWLNTHGILWALITISKKLSHLFALTGKLAVDMATSATLCSGVIFSFTPLVLYVNDRCPPYSTLLFLLSSLPFINHPSFDSHVTLFTTTFIVAFTYQCLAHSPSLLNFLFASQSHAIITFGDFNNLVVDSSHMAASQFLNLFFQWFCLPPTAVTSRFTSWTFSLPKVFS